MLLLSPVLIEPLFKYWFTVSLTSCAVDPSSTATRAPSRDALVNTCWTITIRPYSIIPKTIRKNTGATMANSTAAVARRFLRNNRQGFSSLSLADSKPWPDTADGADRRGTAVAVVEVTDSMRAGHIALPNGLKVYPDDLEAALTALVDHRHDRHVAVLVATVGVQLVEHRRVARHLNARELVETRVVRSNQTRVDAQESCVHDQAERIDIAGQWSRENADITKSGITL